MLDTLRLTLILMVIEAARPLCPQMLGKAYLLQVIGLKIEQEDVRVGTQQPEDLHHIDALPQRAGWHGS